MLIGAYEPQLFPADTAAVQMSLYNDPVDGWVMRCAYRLMDESGWTARAAEVAAVGHDPADALDAAARMLADALQLT